MSTAGETGEWSRDVAYERATGRAVFDGGEYVYTPFAPSEGKFVTVEMATTFPACEGGGSPGADAQAAVRLAANGSFQLWTKRGWLDVAAKGVRPVAGREYSVSVVFDYERGRYSAAVRNPAGEWVAFQADNGAKSFVLAAKKKEISSIAFDGKTVFRSLRGSQTDENPAGIGTSAAFGVADPVEIPAALATTSQTPSEFGRSKSNSPQAPSEFRRSKSNSPQAPSEFQRSKSNSPQGPPEFGWTKSNSPQPPSKFGWTQLKENPPETTI